MPHQVELIGSNWLSNTTNAQWYYTINCPLHVRIFSSKIIYQSNLALFSRRISDHSILIARISKMWSVYFVKHTAEIVSNSFIQWIFFSLHLLSRLLSWLIHVWFIYYNYRKLSDAFGFMLDISISRLCVVIHLTHRHIFEHIIYHLLGKCLPIEVYIEFQNFKQKPV